MKVSQVQVGFEFDIQNAENIHDTGNLNTRWNKVRDTRRMKTNTRKEQMEGAWEAMPWIIIQQENERQLDTIRARVVERSIGNRVGG